MKKNNKLAIPLTLLGFGALAAILIWQHNLSKKIIADVESQIFIPYVKLLNEGKLEEAYQQYTTDGYKKDILYKNIRQLMKRDL